MIVFVHDLNSGWYCEIEIDSRPNKGDGIYLDHYDNLVIQAEVPLSSNLNLSETIALVRGDIKNSVRFEVTDVVFGKLYNSNVKRWIIQGNLDL